MIFNNIQFELYKGSLFDLLHSAAGVVVDTAQAIRFALDIAKGMAYLHSLERIIPEFFLNSFHVMVSWIAFSFRLLNNCSIFKIDEDLTARINMGDCKFSFQERGRVYQPAWMSPEVLQRKRTERNWEACDMFSFAIVVWYILNNFTNLTQAD